MDIEDVIGLAPKRPSTSTRRRAPPTCTCSTSTRRLSVPRRESSPIPSSPRRGDSASSTRTPATRLIEAASGTSSSKRLPRARRSSPPPATPVPHTVTEIRAPPNQHVRSVDDPASQPNVVGVGGTSLGSGPETVWNDAAGSGGGGVLAHGACPHPRASRGSRGSSVPARSRQVRARVALRAATCARSPT